MIKTSGYRVSPTEVEEALYETGLVAEAVAFGKVNPELGQSIIAVVVPLEPATFSLDDVQNHCRKFMPTFMVPHEFVVQNEGLARNPNGKLDRPTIKDALFSS